MAEKGTRITTLPTPSIDEKMKRVESPEAQQFIQEGSVAIPSGQERSPAVVENTDLVSEEAEATVYPWVGVSSSHNKLVSLRAPEDEAAMLKFLGETTYGESAQSILLSALRKEITRRMRARGFNVTQDRKGKVLIKL